MNNKHLVREAGQYRVHGYQLAILRLLRANDTPAEKRVGGREKAEGEKEMRTETGREKEGRRGRGARSRGEGDGGWTKGLGKGGGKECRVKVETKGGTERKGKAI